MSIGSRLGSALGAGINQLADLKLAQLTKQYEQQSERSNFARQWAPLLGKDTANFLSNLSPEERQNALGNLENLTGAFQQPQQQGNLAALAQPFNQQQPNQEQNIDNALKQYFGQPQRSEQQFAQEQPEQQMMQPQEQQQLTPDRAKNIKRLLETPQQKAAREKQEFQERQLNLKETKPYVTALKDKEHAAREANLRLKRMETLIEKGNLPNSAIWSALSKLENAPFVSGLTGPVAELLKGAVKWWHTPADTEEFEKLSNEFVKNAKQYFGSRITQKEVEMFMQTVPTLMQTDAGKKKLIENIRSLNELAEIEAKAARSIIKENGGIPPIDIEQQVQDKIGNKLDKVAKQFIT